MRIALNVVQHQPVSEGVEWWQMADESGIDTIGLPDSPALTRELIVAMTMCAAVTSRARVMASVTNPVTRDPAVMAAALATLNEIAPNRVVLGIGTGDSALWGTGQRIPRLERLREYILAVKDLLRGEEATYDGRRFRMQWLNWEPIEQLPVIVAVSGPKVLKMSCEVADGMLLSMGFGPENIAYVQGLVQSGCAEAGRDPRELELWWNSEVVFGDSVEDAQRRGMGVGTNWLTMGSLEGKQIPDELKEALLEFNRDIHDIGAEYQDGDREQKLQDRARELGLFDWLISRAPGLWGTPDDIAARLQQYDREGLDRWMFYVGRSEADRMNHLRLICEGIMAAVVDT
jgi:5,10-methylenetetrahydromethanopterin reductase